MYESFFRLTKKPFDLLPNPEFLYLSKSHKKALTYLDYAIRERAGFILLTGEIGSGKTTIIRDIIKKHHEHVVLSKIFNTSVSSEQLIAMINDDFGIKERSGDKIEQIRDLNEFLIDQYGKGNKPVLIIDEAQNLTPETLEEVRMLSNLETDSAKLLQIIMVGQPELRETLALSSLKQLRQRISFYCHINPLTQEEVVQYILHRLKVAGNREAVIFSDDAIELIWKYSRGIPRLINIICDFLLLSAFAEETREISADLAKDVIGDLDFENQFWGEDKPDYGRGKFLSKAPQEEKLKELLKKIVHRLDLLEKRTAFSDPKRLEEISNRLEQFDRRILEYMQTTTAELGELRKTARTIEMTDATEIADVTVDTPPGEEGERKKGFFGKLFRAV